MLKSIVNYTKKVHMNEINSGSLVSLESIVNMREGASDRFSHIGFQAILGIAEFLSEKDKFLFFQTTRYLKILGFSLKGILLSPQSEIRNPRILSKAGSFLPQHVMISLGVVPIQRVSGFIPSRLYEALKTLGYKGPIPESFHQIGSAPSRRGVRQIRKDILQALLKIRLPVDSFSKMRADHRESLGRYFKSVNGSTETLEGLFKIFFGGQREALRNFACKESTYVDVAIVVFEEFQRRYGLCQELVPVFKRICCYCQETSDKEVFELLMEMAQNIDKSDSYGKAEVSSEILRRCQQFVGKREVAKFLEIVGSLSKNSNSVKLLCEIGTHCPEEIVSKNIIWDAIVKEFRACESDHNRFHVIAFVAYYFEGLFDRKYFAPLLSLVQELSNEDAIAYSIDTIVDHCGDFMPDKAFRQMLEIVQGMKTRDKVYGEIASYPRSMVWGKLVGHLINLIEGNQLSRAEALDAIGTYWPVLRIFR